MISKVVPTSGLLSGVRLPPRLCPVRWEDVDKRAEGQSMSRKILLIMFSILAVAAAAIAAPTRVVLVGVMSDSHCGLKHSVASDDAAKCVIGCASKDADYVL